MESLRFLNIIGNGNNLGNYSENFCLTPRWKNNWPKFFIFPRSIQLIGHYPKRAFTERDY